MKAQQAPAPEVLLCAPFGKDAQILKRIVELEHPAARECAGLEEVISRLKVGVVLVLLTEEALASKDLDALRQALIEQEPWSDVPIILLASAVDSTSSALTNQFATALAAKANLSILERPVRVPMIRSALRAAKRARARQYQVRDLLLQEVESALRLRLARDDLERRVQERTEALSQANTYLKREIGERLRAEAVLRNLSVTVMNIRDEERRRIARDLHDGVGQVLSLSRMTLSQAIRRTESLPPSTQSLLSEANGLLQQGIDEIRGVCHLLHPPLLDEMGLASALSWYTGEFSKRCGIAVALEMPPDFSRPEPDTETAIFRIVQEGLTNVHRHSGATAASVSLQADAENITLRISDAGKGISPELLARSSAGACGVGIASMRERASQLGGAFRLESSPSGTAIMVTVPFRDRL